MIKDNPPNWKSISLLLLLSITWSSSFYFIKLGVVAASPLVFTTLRLVCGAVGFMVGYMAVYMAGYGGRLVRKSPLLPSPLYPFVLIALGGNVAPFLLIGWGEQFSPSTEAAIIIGAMPCFALLLGIMFLKEEVFSRGKLVGIALGLVAVVVLLRGKQPEPLPTVAFVLAAFSYAATAVYGKRLTQMYSVWDIVGLSTILAAGFIVLLWLWQGGGVAELKAIDRVSLRAAVVMGLVHTAAAGLVFFYLLRTCGIVFTSFCNYAVPVLGTFWGWVLLAEALGATQLLALALVVAGLVVVRRSTSQ